jgi:hypothetical protein
MNSKISQMFSPNLALHSRNIKPFSFANCFPVSIGIILSLSLEFTKSEIKLQIHKPILFPTKIFTILFLDSLQDNSFAHSVATSNEYLSVTS